MIRSTFTVDLYVYAAHEVAVWEPIWWRLRERGVDAQVIVEPPGVNRARGSVPDKSNGWRDDKSGSAIEDLMNVDMYETVCASLQRRGLPWLDAARLHADAVVTTSGIGWFDEYRGLRIRAMYGVGAVVDSYGHGPVNDGMDLVLTHGPFSSQAIRARSPQTRTEVVGFPKWSEQRRSRRSRADARAELGIEDVRGPVVAWLPTWAHNSSLDRFSDSLADLATDHTVIAKPHHNNLRFERSRLASVDASVEMVPDLDTLVPLIVAADVVVGDVRSGGMTEALLGDRPVVGLSPDGPLDHQGLLVGLGDAVALCADPDGLRSAITTAMEPRRADARRRWSTWFFGTDDGEDDRRAADAIVARIDEERRRIDPGPTAAELDDLLSLEAGTSIESVEAAFLQTWPTWADDPRLPTLLERLATDADIASLERCSATVRLTGHVETCPLRRRWLADGAPTEERLAAAAVAAVTFADDAAAGAFIELAAGVDPGELSACLVAVLSYEPSLLPAFIGAAATSTAQRDQLATALRDLGAERSEIDLLLAA